MNPLPPESYIDRMCPVCGSAKRRLFAKQNVDFDQLGSLAFASRKPPEYMHWQLMECAQCDLLYASPIPRLQDISEAYRDAEFDSHREAELASRTYARVLKEFSDRLPDLVGALDIGTGDGVFLRRLLEAGFQEVAGVEPSLAPIQSAEDDVRPLIRQGLFEPGVFSPDSFSLITCFQTIEHIDHPVMIPAESMRLLKPGGALLLICHNRRSLSAKLMGRKSPIFDVEHLQLFSPRSVRQLLERAGYKDVTVRPLVNRYPISYWLRLMPLPRGLKRILSAGLQKVRLADLLIPLPAGNLVVYGFKS